MSFICAKNLEPPESGCAVEPSFVPGNTGLRDFRSVIWPDQNAELYLSHAKAFTHRLDAFSDDEFIHKGHYRQKYQFLSSMNILDEIDGDKILTLIRRKNLTQKEVATLLGFGQPNLSKKIHGVIPWTDKELGKLAQILSVERGEFYKEPIKSKSDMEDDVHTLYREVVEIRSELRKLRSEVAELSKRLGELDAAGVKLLG